MIFSDGKNNIAGYDPRFILLMSSVDYVALYLTGEPFTWQLAGWIFDVLPVWLAFVPGAALLMAGCFLCLIGPLVLLYLIYQGWKMLGDK